MNRGFRRPGANARMVFAGVVVLVAALALSVWLFKRHEPGHGDDGHAHSTHGSVPAAARPAPAAAHAAGERAEGAIALSDTQIREAGIATASAGPAVLATMLRLPGEIRYNEERTAHVVPRVNGVVVSVSANLGQQVRKGQVLAAIASPAIAEQRSELLSARRRLALAQSTFEREKRLWEEKISAQQDYLQATQAVQEAEIAVGNAREKLVALGADTGGAGALNRYELRAPFDGMVMEKHITLGESVKEDTQVFTLSDLSSVWAEINVAARDLPLVRVGGKARVTATAFDASAEGTIAYIGSLIGEQTRTARGRVVLPNPQGVWRPGLFASIEITAAQSGVTIAVPNEAIQTIDNHPVVFVRTRDGFVARRVRTGRSDSLRTEITQGLEQGAVYATGNTFTLKAELGKSKTGHAH